MNTDAKHDYRVTEASTSEDEGGGQMFFSSSVPDQKRSINKPTDKSVYFILCRFIQYKKRIIHHDHKNNCDFFNKYTFLFSMICLKKTTLLISCHIVKSVSVVFTLKCLRRDRYDLFI